MAGPVAQRIAPSALLLFACAAHAQPQGFGQGGFDGGGGYDGGGGMGMDDNEGIDTAAMDFGTKAHAPACTYTSPREGYKWDLRPMKRADHDFSGTTPGGYTYRFNVCGGTVKVCNRVQAPANKWRGTKCNNLGEMSTQSFSLLDESDPTAGLKVTYRDGDICKKQVGGQMEIGSRQVTYEIQCDPGQDPALLKNINEVSMCDYTITFLSKHGCATNAGAGSRGWTFVTLVILVAVAYFGGGVAINRYKFGLQGVEAVPNLEMWRQLPGLVGDGVSFSAGMTKTAIEEVKRRYAERQG